LDAAVVLLDDFDNPMGARLDQHRAAVDDRVTVFPSAIFRRHIIIGNAFLRQNCADPHILAILIGRAALFDHIVAKARTLIDAENAAYTTDHTANDAADDGTERPGSSFALSRAPLNPAGHTLGKGHDGQRQDGGNSGYSDKTADHEDS
jgi:hypothetical protein